MRVLLALALLIAAGPAAAAPLALDGGRMGVVHLSVPDRPRDFVFEFSDDMATSDGVVRSLVALGAVVASVDLRHYLDALRSSGGDCLYLLSEIESLSRRAQRQLGFKEYRLPILAGTGAGAGLVYGALAQAPASTLAGAASVDFSPVIDTRIPLCPGAVATPVAGGEFRYAPRSSLPGWWRVTGTRPISAEVAAFVTQVKGAELLPTDPMETPAAAMARLLRPVIGKPSRLAGTSASVANIPLTELPARRDPPLLAVIYSGDGGWRDLDKQIGEMLQSAGVAVVGVDSLRYFWRKKTPDRVAADLERIISHYGSIWGVDRVMLIGYSFGADILPFAVNRLDPGTRAEIVQVSLLGLARKADFEIHVTGWFGGGPSREALPILPEIARLDPALLQCFYGAEEKDSACPDLALASAEVIETAGGHHFDGDYVALAKKILAGARRRAGLLP